MPLQLDREDASFARYVAHAQRPSVRFNSSKANGQAEAKPCSIRAPLLERKKQLIGTSRWQPAALVLDLDDLNRRKSRDDSDTIPLTLHDRNILSCVCPQ